MQEQLCLLECLLILAHSKTKWGPTNFACNIYGIYIYVTYIYIYYIILHTVYTYKSIYSNTRLFYRHFSIPTAITAAAGKEALRYLEANAQHLGHQAGAGPQSGTKNMKKQMALDFSTFFHIFHIFSEPTSQSDCSFYWLVGTLWEQIDQPTSYKSVKLQFQVCWRHCFKFGDIMFMG